MKTTFKRQKTLSFKITDRAEAQLDLVRVAMAKERGIVYSKTDVIEIAISLLSDEFELSERQIAKKIAELEHKEDA